MVIESRWHELIGRAKHFRGDDELFKKQALENEVFYMALYDLKENLIAGLGKIGELNRQQILERVFLEVFNFVTRQYSGFAVFCKNKILYEHVFEACFFTTLCIFINGTKRIKGISLRRFLYEYSPNQYNFKGSNDVKRSKCYFDYDYPEKDSLGFTYIEKEETTLRQMRYRLLSTRTAYDKRPEWAALRVDSKYEWAFLYVLNDLDQDLLDVYKRIGNLYNDINAALHAYKTSPTDREHHDRLEDAFMKFTSKLKKIKYAKFLGLQKEILLYICNNKSHYGMNMYRFERKLRLYNITSEVKRLLEAKDAAEESNIIKKAVILNNLHFPKLYQDFSDFPDLRDTAFCSNIFSLLMDFVVGSSRLIIDELVEKGFLGEDWEKFFLDTINEMTERVFYNPMQIDYTIAPGSQEQFNEFISAPVRDLLFRSVGLSFPR